MSSAVFGVSRSGITCHISGFLHIRENWGISGSLIGRESRENAKLHRKSGKSR